MSNLVISVVAISLFTVALGIAAFYGGPALLGGQAQAEAGRLHNESKTILSAILQLQYDTFSGYPMMTTKQSVDDYFNNRLSGDADRSDYLRFLPEGGAFASRRSAAGGNPGWEVNDRFLFTEIGDPTDDPNLEEEFNDVCQNARELAGFPAAYGPSAPVEPLSCGSSQAAVDVMLGGETVTMPGGIIGEIGVTVAHPLDPCCVCDDPAAGHELCQ